ncbi:kinase-like protein [Cryphonectria parasitica EP155]|uniref:EKC/KEOPS complex subunit BUD32 n=1 Tax=Cryphonectria parasitica (strain ATCC 38755 / EP155) TaxID=660469 RepID=A0A9P5CRH7_CRYP1|nr:kinase-like protein [Cryphonectria parasitica EP155]KAF3768258.1 kinase-like protein [Cryphonectria parasitica EP155]
MTTNHLRIGPLDFVLTLAVENESAYAAARDKYMRKWYQQWDLEGGGGGGHGRLDVLPRPEHQCIRNVVLHHIISKGAFGVVIAGVDRRSGDPIACKIIYCCDCDSGVVNNEIDIASRIPAQTFAFETVYLVMPYAPWSFDGMPWQDVPLATRLSLFRQVLEGLRNLHARGIMHRDISPRNLLVFSRQPPHAAICDYGKSKVGTRGKLAALGPPDFTAPEVGRPEGYTSAIDIFSLGLSMLATFGPRGWTGPMSSPENHRAVLEHVIALQGRMPDGLGALLRSMLAWDPADRPTAEQALAEQVWEQVAGAAARPGTAAAGARGGKDSHGHGPGGGSTAARLRRSGGMSPSGSRGVRKRRRRGPPSSGGSKEQGMTSLLQSGSLLSPPPV